MLLTIVLILLVLAFFAQPHFAYARAWGPTPSTVLLILGVLLVVWLLVGGGLPSLHCR